MEWLPMQVATGSQPARNMGKSNWILMSTSGACVPKFWVAATKWIRQSATPSSSCLQSTCREAFSIWPIRWDDVINSGNASAPFTQWNYSAINAGIYCLLYDSKELSSSYRSFCSISISRKELFRLNDVANGLRLLRDIAEVAPEMQLIQAEPLIKKTSQCAWNLIHEELDSRWQTRHSNIDLSRRS